MSLIELEKDEAWTGGAHPVFFDRRGNRWTWICTLVIVGTLTLAALVLYLIPRTTAPLWRVQQNTGVAYPKQIAYDAKSTWPIIGNGDLLRVIQIERDDGNQARVYAHDPFSDVEFRQLTTEESDTVADSGYAIERYGKLPAKTLAITFDDGPDAKWTPQILDVLAAERVQATFFDIGTNIAKNPDLAQRTVREGHLVGNHTLDHVDFDAASSVRGQQEWILNDHISRSVTGRSTQFARLPYGGGTVSDLQNNRRGILVAQQLGYIPVSFDLDTNDWKWKEGHPGPPLDLSDGASHVVLMHDAGGNRAMSVTYLRELIRSAKAQGYSFSTVAALAPRFAAPQKITPAVTDRATYWVAKLILVTPAVLVRALFKLNVTTIALVTLATLVLAMVSTRRSRRSQWSTDYDPFVSVVIAAFNEEKVIAHTLDRLTQSSYPNYEVIVINDGSTDRTLDVLLDIAEQWKRVGRELTIINQPNGGKWAALNNGIKHARSDVIVTLDADTIFLPDTMGYLVRHFEDSDVGAVAGVVKVGNVHNLLTAWQSLDYLSGIATDRTAQQLIGGIMIVPGACAAWRKWAVVGAGGFTDATLAEDQDLTLAIHQAGFKVLQENHAVALTEAPGNVRDLIRQRFRWTYGSLQAMWKNRRMFLRRGYGGLGFVVLPYTATSILVPLVFLPVTYMIMAEAFFSGHAGLVLLYFSIFVSVHFVTTAAAILILRERWWHLLIVPFYRLINEPLRVYLLYATLLTALRGRPVGWNKVQRRGDVKGPSLVVATEVIA